MAPSPTPSLCGERRELVPVVDPVPGDVDCDGRTRSGQAMNERGVRDPLVDVRAAPGHGNTPKRVPELPYPHEGVSISRSRRPVTTASMSIP